MTSRRRLSTATSAGTLWGVGLAFRGLVSGVLVNAALSAWGGVEDGASGGQGA